MSRKGFTLIELVMVIVIIGILAAVAIPKFISLSNEAEKAVCQSNVGAIRTALANFYAKCQVNETAVAGITHTNECFPVSAQLDYNATTPSAFGADYFAEGNLPNNDTITGTAGNWGDALKYNNTTGVVDMDECCG